MVYGRYNIYVCLEHGVKLTIKHKWWGPTVENLFMIKIAETIFVDDIHILIKHDIIICNHCIDNI